MKIYKRRPQRRNDRGFITIQYMFSFFLVMGFSMVIISFAATLSMVEITQYIAFATARNYFAGNIDQNGQQQMANAKLSSLMSNPLIKPLASGGWFKIGATTNVGSDFQQYAPDSEHNTFEGAMISFSSNILAMQIPFFGSTVKSGQDSSNAFSTNVTAFLGREPTFNECSQFTNQRWQAIQQLNNLYGQGSKTTQTVYYPINDNGC